jgi:hypothetical protein
MAQAILGLRVGQNTPLVFATTVDRPGGHAHADRGFPG